MNHVRRILQNFTAFILSAVLTMLPTMGIMAPVLDTLEDDCLLNVSMISDTHLEQKELFRQAFLWGGLQNMKRAKCPINALLADGDITNYGDQASIDTFYHLIDRYSPVRTLISVPGNHDIGHVEDRDHDDVRESLIASYNAYAGTDYDKSYYTTEIGGYTFIVLCDEGDRWDACTMSQAQLDFLDESLAQATADGKPAFVCCHWPIEDTNGEKTIWPGSGMEMEGQNVQAILEKYKNVFYISGHMHAGIKSHAVEEKFGLSNAETINGVTYINLPTYGIINWFGVPWSGTGAQLEVYADKVVFRPRSFLTGHWYVNSMYTFDLANGE